MKTAGYNREKEKSKWAAVFDLDNVLGVGYGSKDLWDDFALKDEYEKAGLWE